MILHTQFNLFSHFLEIHKIMQTSKDYCTYFNHTHFFVRIKDTNQQLAIMQMQNRIAVCGYALISCKGQWL